MAQDYVTWIQANPGKTAQDYNDYTRGSSKPSSSSDDDSSDSGSGFTAKSGGSQTEQDAADAAQKQINDALASQGFDTSNRETDEQREARERREKERKERREKERKERESKAREKAAKERKEREAREKAEREAQERAEREAEERAEREEEAERERLFGVDETDSDEVGENAKPPVTTPPPATPAPTSGPPVNDDGSPMSTDEMIDAGIDPSTGQPFKKETSGGGVIPPPATPAPTTPGLDGELGYGDEYGNDGDDPFEDKAPDTFKKPSGERSPSALYAIPPDATPQPETGVPDVLEGDGGILAEASRQAPVSQPEQRRGEATEPGPDGELGYGDEYGNDGDDPFEDKAPDTFKKPSGERSPSALYAIPPDATPQPETGVPDVLEGDGGILAEASRQAPVSQPEQRRGEATDLFKKTVLDAKPTVPELPSTPSGQQEGGPPAELGDTPYSDPIDVIGVAGETSGDTPVPEGYTPPSRPAPRSARTASAIPGDLLPTGDEDITSGAVSEHDQAVIDRKRELRGGVDFEGSAERLGEQGSQETPRPPSTRTASAIPGDILPTGDEDVTSGAVSNPRDWYVEGGPIRGDTRTEGYLERGEKLEVPDHYPGEIGPDFSGVPTEALPEGATRPNEPVDDPLSRDLDVGTLDLVQTGKAVAEVVAKAHRRARTNYEHAVSTPEGRAALIEALKNSNDNVYGDIRHIQEYVNELLTGDPLGAPSVKGDSLPTGDKDTKAGAPSERDQAIIYRRLATLTESLKNLEGGVGDNPRDWYVEGGPIRGDTRTEGYLERGEKLEVPDHYPGEIGPDFSGVPTEALPEGVKRPNEPPDDPRTLVQIIGDQLERIEQADSTGPTRYDLLTEVVSGGYIDTSTYNEQNIKDQAGATREGVVKGLMENGYSKAEAEAEVGSRQAWEESALAQTHQGQAGKIIMRGAGEVMLPPGYATKRDWHETGWAGRAGGLFLDAVEVLPAVGLVAAASARTIPLAGAGVRSAKMVEEGAHMFDPGAAFKMLRSPVDTTKQIGKMTKAGADNIVGGAFSLRAIEDAETTVKLVSENYFDNVADMMDFRREVFDQVTQTGKARVPLPDGRMFEYDATNIRDVIGGPVAFHGSPFGDKLEGGFLANMGIDPKSGKLVKINEELLADGSKGGMFWSPGAGHRWALSTSGGEVGSKPSILITRSPEKHAVLDKRGGYKTKQGTMAEFEGITETGVPFLPPHQTIRTYSPRGDAIEIMVLDGDKITNAQIARLKLEAGRETLKRLNPFYSPVRITDNADEAAALSKASTGKVKPSTSAARADSPGGSNAAKGGDGATGTRVEGENAYDDVIDPETGQLREDFTGDSPTTRLGDDGVGTREPDTPTRPDAPQGDTIFEGDTDILVDAAERARRGDLAPGTGSARPLTSTIRGVANARDGAVEGYDDGIDPATGLLREGLAGDSPTAPREDGATGRRREGEDAYDDVIDPETGQLREDFTGDSPTTRLGDDGVGTREPDTPTRPDAPQGDTIFEGDTDILVDAAERARRGDLAPGTGSARPLTSTIRGVANARDGAVEGYDDGIDPATGLLRADFAGDSPTAPREDGRRSEGGPGSRGREPGDYDVVEQGIDAYLRGEDTEEPPVIPREGLAGDSPTAPREDGATGRRREGEDAYDDVIDPETGQLREDFAGDSPTAPREDGATGRRREGEDAYLDEFDPETGQLREDPPREDSPREDPPREDGATGRRREGEDAYLDEFDPETGLLREDPPREDSPREDPPREDPPREDSPREDPPREDPPPPTRPPGTPPPTRPPGTPPPTRPPVRTHGPIRTDPPPTRPPGTPPPTRPPGTPPPTRPPVRTHGPIRTDPPPTRPPGTPPPTRPPGTPPPTRPPVRTHGPIRTDPPPTRPPGTPPPTRPPGTPPPTRPPVRTHGPIRTDPPPTRPPGTPPPTRPPGTPPPTRPPVRTHGPIRTDPPPTRPPVRTPGPIRTDPPRTRVSERLRVPSLFRIPPRDPFPETDRFLRTIREPSYRVAARVDPVRSDLARDPVRAETPRDPVRAELDRAPVRREPSQREPERPARARIVPHVRPPTRVPVGDNSSPRLRTPEPHSTPNEVKRTMERRGYYPRTVEWQVGTVKHKLNLATGDHKTARSAEQARTDENYRVLEWTHRRTPRREIDLGPIDIHVDAAGLRYVRDPLHGQTAQSPVRRTRPFAGRRF